MNESSYNGSNYDENNDVLSENTFLRIAQSIDNEMIQAKVMIFLQII